jgi:hypothetical protein
LVVASLYQGVKHFGRNNAFCLATKHGLAMLCNDMHVLENMHTSMCFAILYSCGILPNLQRDSYERLRSHVIEVIISTDMSAHFSLVAKFRIRGIGSQFSPVGEVVRVAGQAFRLLLKKSTAARKERSILMRVLRTWVSKEIWMRVTRMSLRAPPRNSLSISAKHVEEGSWPLQRSCAQGKTMAGFITPLVSARAYKAPSWNLDVFISPCGGEQQALSEHR